MKSAKLNAGESPGQVLRRLLIMTIAGLISAFGITFFLYPVGLYDSGIAGTAMFLSQITPLNISAFLLILNIPLMLYGLKKQGKAFTFYAIYAVASLSVFTMLLEHVIPFHAFQGSPFGGTDYVLCAVFGGLICGFGSGLSIRYGGAIDGIEVLAVVISNKRGTSVGTIVMMYNAVLYIICGIVISQWEGPLYSIITYAAATLSVDFLVEGLDRSKSVMIITEQPEEICESLSESFGQGITIIDAKGWYSGTSKTMVYIVLNRFQITSMRDLVHLIDPNAYITIGEIADVYKLNS